MLELTKGQTSERIIVTLNELKTLTSPYYLFVFTHVTTKDQVKFIAGADLSAYPERFNQFEVNTQELFGEFLKGEWHYNVYEQASNVNLDPANSTGLVENGKLSLNDSTDFNYQTYDIPVTYKAYNG